jgi:rod shape-determining protein MreC
MKFWKNKLAVTVIVLSVAFLGVIIYSVKSTQGSAITGVAGNALNPIQKLTYNVIDKAKGGVDFFFHFSNVKNENEELKRQNIKLENDLIEYNSLKSENNRLRNLLDFKDEKSKYNYIVTNIVAKSDGGFKNDYIIDKGEKDGLVKGMIVVSSTGEEGQEGVVGLVGQVTEVDDNWSKIQTLTNQNMAVSAMVQSTNDSTGIVKGFKDSDKNMLAKIYYLPMNSDIKQGDVITTSGLGRLYPKDLRIGEVISVEEDNVNVMKNAVIKPYVDFTRLGELMVIVPTNYINEDSIKYD